MSLKKQSFNTQTINPRCVLILIISTAYSVQIQQCPYHTKSATGFG